LGNGAFAFFGSSTIAFGESVGLSAADLSTQYFLQSILKGASTGRATLQARQEYILKHSELNPIDLKTLAQFNLLGDRSIHPVRVQKTSPKIKALKMPQSSTGANVSQGIIERRASLVSKGMGLGQSASAASTSSRTEVSTTERRELVARFKAKEKVMTMRFSIAPPKNLMKSKSAATNTLVQAYFEIAIGSMDENQSSHSLVAIVSRVHGAERVERAYLSR
jgi:hypothetical protein